MSLDISLYYENHNTDIAVKDNNGNEIELTIDDIRKCYPEAYFINEDYIEVFDINITHNLGEMALKAGIYYALWKPEEIHKYQAKDILPILKNGYELLTKYPDFYKKYNSPNGFGVYEDFLKFVNEVIKACENDPDAYIDISR